MEFKELAEQTCSRLRKRGAYGSSSDLYVNEKHGVAVIGVQTSQSGFGHDTIYLLRKDGTLDTLLDETSRQGRMWPTGISEDGRTISYVIKTDEGKRLEKVYRI